MSELEDIWHDQEQYTPRGVSALKAENERLRAQLEAYRRFLRAFVQQPDLEDMAADGVTVWQVYQKEARSLLKGGRT